jgi:hypothetical protein
MVFVGVSAFYVIWKARSQGKWTVWLIALGFLMCFDLFFYRFPDKLRYLGVEQAGKREKKTGRADQKLFHGCRGFELRVWRVFLR